jgi:hypothetical protein
MAAADELIVNWERPRRDEPSRRFPLFPNMPVMEEPVDITDVQVVPAFFARVGVDVDAGTITWPGGLDMAPEPLYEEARRNVADRRAPG